MQGVRMGMRSVLMHLALSQRPPSMLGVPPKGTLGVLVSVRNPSIFLCPYLRNMMSSFIATVISLQPPLNPNLVRLAYMSGCDLLGVLVKLLMKKKHWRKDSWCFYLLDLSSSSVDASSRGIKFKTCSMYVLVLGLVPFQGFMYQVWNFVSLMNSRDILLSFYVY